MTVVHLVRHAIHDEVGRVLSGRSEIGLNDAGRKEARALAEHLAETPLSAIQSGPRRRTIETAEVLATPHRLETQIVDALDEIDFGAWTGRSFATLAGDPEWRRWNTERGRAAAPGGEAMGDAVARARGHIDALALADGAVLCVTHCDIIRGVVASYLGLDLDRILGFDCDPASVTTIALRDGGGQVVGLNRRPA